MDDRRIVEGIKKGDEEAFIEFANAFKKKLVMFCFSYTKDLYEAEDLSQEVFIKFFKSMKYFRYECSLSTYLYRIARNFCIDYYRRKRIKQIFGGLDFLKNNSEVENISSEDKLVIRKCILGLPENMRIIVILYYYIGLSEREIADILKISERAVEGRLYRVKQKLKKELEIGEVILCKEKKMI